MYSSYHKNATHCSGIIEVGNNECFEYSHSVIISDKIGDARYLVGELAFNLYYRSVPMHPGKQIRIPGHGNVLEFCKIRKCPGKNIACEKMNLEQKRLNNYYACRRKLQL